MQPNSDSKHNQSSRIKITTSLFHLWERITNIGVDSTLKSWQKRRTNLVNFICAVAILFYCIYTLSFLAPQYRLTFYECLIPIFFYLIPIVLNYFKQYIFAVHFFMLFNLALYTTSAIAHGAADASEYMLLPASIFAMFFFKDLWLIITYFILNMICFFGCKYAFTVVKPFLIMYNHENFYWSTHLTVFLVIFFIVNFFKRQHARHERFLETARLLLDEKNKDITSSIQYAKRIQMAMLPPLEQLHSFVPQSFVLYKPKDIVSGDFYWFGESNGNKIIAVVDCTGHGVPGAFMSMIGHNLLNLIVNENGVVEPDKILNDLHHRVQAALRQGTNAVDTSDGMDAAICVINSTNTQLHFAGAYRPLICVNQSGFTKIDGNKFPIGGKQFDANRKFLKHKITINSGDTFYLSTDGFADQFGGPSGKKYKVKRFYELLLSLQDKSMQAQNETMANDFMNWKGLLNQLDDILVIGLRF